MSVKDLILAIDNGTQSLKAIVFDETGTLLAKEQVGFEPYFSKQPGWAEQDPEVFWNTLCQACQALWKQNPQFKERIAGVTLTTQRGTVINVDPKGNPLRPAILWLDQRKTHGLPFIGGPWGFLFKLIRLNDTIAYFQSEAEANWIHAYQPDLWGNTHKYLLLSGFLTHRLTGKFVDSIGCQVGYVPFDYRHMRWASSWDWKWRCLPVQKDILPDLVPPGQVLGTITNTASAATGIPKDLPLIAAAADKACEVIGSGSLDSSVGCLSYGTTATINVTHKKYIEPIPLLPPYPSAVPGYHTVEVQVFRGYWMVNWFKEEFGHPERREARKSGQTPETLFEKLLEDIPPCSMGLGSPALLDSGVEITGARSQGGHYRVRGYPYPGPSLSGYHRRTGLCHA